MRSLRKILILQTVIIFLFSGIVAGQSSEKFSESAWKEVKEGIDYSSDHDMLRKKDKFQGDGEKTAGEKPDDEFYEEQNSSGNRVINLPGIAQPLIYLVFVAILFVILYLFLKNAGVTNKKVRYTSEGINLENIEENIHETDLDKLLKKTLSEGDFMQAIRLLYLTIIKDLSEKKLIDWHKNKTNREYLYELANEEFKKKFEKLTLLFEWAWYGDIKMDEKIYSQLEPKFVEFKNTLDQVGKQ